MRSQQPADQKRPTNGPGGYSVTWDAALNVPVVSVTDAAYARKVIQCVAHPPLLLRDGLGLLILEMTFAVCADTLEPGKSPDPDAVAYVESACLSALGAAVPDLLAAAGWTSATLGQWTACPGFKAWKAELRGARGLLEQVEEPMPDLPVKERVRRLRRIDATREGRLALESSRVFRGSTLGASDTRKRTATYMRRVLGRTARPDEVDETLAAMYGRSWTPDARKLVIIDKRTRALVPSPNAVRATAQRELGLHEVGGKSGRKLVRLYAAVGGEVMAVEHAASADLDGPLDGIELHRTLEAFQDELRDPALRAALDLRLARFTSEEAAGRAYGLTRDQVRGGVRRLEPILRSRLRDFV